MTTLVRGRDVTGMPVVDRTTGDALADVADVIFDPGQGCLAGFTLRKRSLFHRRLREVLPVDGVSAIGTHAVMVEGGDALSAPDDAPDAVSDADPKKDVLDAMVVTESGRQLGRVADVVIAGGPSPRVVGFQIGGGPAGEGFVPLDAHRGLSDDALVVPDDYESRIRHDLTGLAGQLGELGSAS